MRILITGANGFIGRHLVKRMLLEGHEVFAVATEGLQTTNKNLHEIICFFDDYGSLFEIVNSDIDIVYHLAWDGLCGQKAKDVKLQLKNIVATEELLKNAKKMNAKKFIFVSTMNTLEVMSYLKKPEECTPRGTYVHVASKINAEVIARNYCYENDIVYSEAILAMIYGEGNFSKMVPNVFMYSVANGVAPKLIAGNNYYDLVYIQDVINALVCIGFRGKRSSSYYVGHNWNKTFKELFTEIGRIINPQVKLIFGQYPDENKIDFDLVDREKLTRDTGWKIESDFEKSIRTTTQWLCDSNFKL